MGSTGRLMKILRRSVLISGAVARSVIGIGAAALFFFSIISYFILSSCSSISLLRVILCGQSTSSYSSIIACLL